MYELFQPDLPFQAEKAYVFIRHDLCEKDRWLQKAMELYNDNWLWKPFHTASRAAFLIGYQ